MNQFIYDSARTLKQLIVCLIRGYSPKAALSCDISFESVPVSTRFPHPVGIVVGTGVVMGENCMILQNVTIGRSKPSGQTGIFVGDSVTIYAGAIVLGPVEIGSNSIIGAGAIVTKNVPPCTIVTGVNTQR